VSATADSAERPRPEPSALTEDFWAAARRHELVRPVCRDCGASFFTPQIACPACLSEDWVYKQSSGRGTVYSATVVHRAPFPGLQTPYQVAIVDLEEGWSMLTNVIEADVMPTPIGTPVEVAFLDVDRELTLPAFRPLTGVAR
jgi:uncharacterized OB-fold protein